MWLASGPRERCPRGGIATGPWICVGSGISELGWPRLAWVPGRWEQPPRPPARWVSHRWTHQRHGWVLVEGHWRQARFTANSTCRAGRPTGMWPSNVRTQPPGSMSDSVCNLGDASLPGARLCAIETAATMRKRSRYVLKASACMPALSELSSSFGRRRCQRGNRKMS